MSDEVRRRGPLDDVVVACAPFTLGAGVPLLPRRLEVHLADVARDVSCARFDLVGETHRPVI